MQQLYGNWWAAVVSDGGNFNVAVDAVDNNLIYLTDGARWVVLYEDCEETEG